MSAYRDALTDDVLCAECDKPIGRAFFGSIEAWGHRVNPGPYHHTARPSAPRIGPKRAGSPGGASRGQPRSPKPLPADSAI